MNHIHADDGRILTPPKELEPLLKGAFQAFYDLIGHIRFFYVADEIWDGKTSLVFKANCEQLAAITLGDSVFYISITDENFSITDETTLDMVYEALKKSATETQRRPAEQLAPHLDKYPCGIRCDMCLGSKNSDANNYSPSEDFGYMDWLCYHNCLPGIDVGYSHGVYVCQGCTARKEICRTHICLEERGIKNCFECGEYRTCEHCGVGHNPGECNLGITAEEVTYLIIPYCEVERLDLLRKNKNGK